MEQLNGDSVEWVRGAILVLLGGLTYFLKRVLHNQEITEKIVQDLKLKIALILDRDRRKRLSDYRMESDSSSESDEDDGEQ